MIVYGDHDETADPIQRLRALQHRLNRMASLPPGLERHSALVGALVEAGQLLQGVADAEFEAAGYDRRTEATDQLSLILQRLGRAACRSWDGGFAELPALPRIPDFRDLPVQVRLRVPEGFAFYAVYPEAYAAAARRLKLSAPPRVIGIRSIGTTLAAIVAAALDAPPPVTVRPFGDPYARRISLAAELELELLEGEAHYVIVDEGPGQSGSSFGCVADWLEERGVPLERIAFIASHAGDVGPRASSAHRARWRCVQRSVADLGQALPGLLRSWAEPLLGPIDQFDEISAGGWRAQFYDSEQDWPVAVPMWERRKFLATAAGERFLLKFAGLGRFGEEKLVIARALNSEGFGVEPVALLHGFVVERWCEGQPLKSADQPVREIGNYIGRRARLFGAPPDSGATIAALFDMSRNNVAEEFGDARASALDGCRPKLTELERTLVRSRTDNRLQRHEWLRAAAGRLVKTDALDHHCGHDLIGCQDMAWDIAGAISEFSLDNAQARLLLETAEDVSLRRVDPQLLEFYRIAYAAFGLARERLAAMLAGTSAAERERLNAAAHRYRAELQELLHLPCVRASTRQESAVGEET